MVDQKKKGKYIGLAGALLVHVAFIAFLLLVAFKMPEQPEEGGMPVMMGEIPDALGGGKATMTEVDVLPQEAAPASPEPSEQEMITQTEEETVAVPEKKKLDYVIVLGARVYPDKMSVSLKNRLDKAYEYHVENPETKFVLSGGQGDNEYLPEAVAMYNYLHLKGMPEENMILEMFSTSTTENIAFSMIAIDEDIKKTERDVIEDIKDSAQMKLRERIEFGIYPVERGVEFIEDSILGDNEGLSLKEAAEAAEEVRRTQVAADKGPSVGVLTNDFHVMRAVLIAKKRGFENVSGISAPSDPILLPHFFVRECAAIIKDRIMGNM